VNLCAAKKTEDVQIYKLAKNYNMEKCR